MRRLFQSLKQPEWIFLVLALLSGCCLCFLIPTQSGFDEITHLARIWEISGGYFIPNQKLSQGPYLPQAFVDISYRDQFFYDPVDPSFFTIYGSERIDWNVFVDHQTRSVYFPTLYLPQAFAVGLLGRVLDAPVLLMVYICRMLYLLGYILFAFFAIRSIPVGKWLLMVLALAPMAMYQAVTISPDAYTNGACFLFIAWMLKLAFQEKQLGWKQLWLTIGITALLLSVKVNAVFLLPLLLLPVWKGFESRKMLPILVGAVALLFAGFVVGWNLIAYSKYYVNAPGYGASGQLAYVISNPLKYGATFIQDISLHGGKYLREWIAIYGYDAGRVPPATYILFGLFLVVAWLFSTPQPHIDTRTRITLLIAGIASCFFSVLVLYLTFNRIGSNSIEGVQGRYFIPFMPALFLGMVPGREIIPRWVTHIFRIAVGTGVAITLAVYTLGIYLSFYVICGTSLYTPGLCYQPLYKNWESDPQMTQPVTKDVVLQQPFLAVCSPLRSIRVWSAAISPDIAGKTRFNLKDDANGEVLAEESIDNHSVADYAWLEVSFPPINDANGKRFVLEITSSLSDPRAAISFGVTPRREYLYGLIANNAPADYDLMFQYGCEP